MSYKIFDAHLHIIDPRFPLITNQNYLPPYFTVADYQTQRPQHTVGGVVVSGSFQGTDQSYLLAALQQLGNNYVGITQLPDNITDEEITKLNQLGVRGIRFNLYRGSTVTPKHLQNMALRVYELVQWHIEIYADTANINDFVPTLLTLPKFALDHLGMSQAGLPTTLKLAEAGARIKATGFSRTNLNISQTLQAINRVNPEALMFGTDLPSTRAPTPFSEKDIITLVDALGDSSSQALFTNGYNFYFCNRTIK